MADMENMTSGLQKFILSNTEGINKVKKKMPSHQYDNFQAYSWSQDEPYITKKPKPGPVPTPWNDYEEEPMPNFQKGDSVIERTLVMLKPDAFERGLVGEIMDMIDRRGMKVVAAKLFVMTQAQCQKHYKHHVSKDFFPDLVAFMTGGPSFAIVYEGEQACNAVRQLIGQKHPSQSPAGSIRGKYAMEFPRNLIHGSDHKEDANYEISLYFTQDEIYDETYVAKMDQINAAKAAKAAEAKQKILDKGAKVGDVIEYPWLVKEGDILNLGPYFYNVDDMAVNGDDVHFDFTLLSHKNHKLDGSYTDESWGSDANPHGFSWILVKRGDDTAKGFDIPIPNKPINKAGLPKYAKSQSNTVEEYSMWNPWGENITKHYLTNTHNYPLALEVFANTAEKYKDEAENAGVPFKLKKNGQALFVHDGHTLTKTGAA